MATEYTTTFAVATAKGRTEAADEGPKRGTAIAVLILQVIPLLDSATGSDAAQWVGLFIAVGLLLPEIAQALREPLVSLKLTLLLLVVAVPVAAILEPATLVSGISLLSFGALLYVLGYRAGVDERCRSGVVAGLAAAAAVGSILVISGLAEDAGHIEKARIAALGVALAPFLPSEPWFFARRPQFAAAFLAFLSLTATLLSGSRGPLVASVLAVAIVGLSRSHSVYSAGRSVAILVGIVAASGIAFRLVSALSQDSNTEFLLSRQRDLVELRPDQFASAEDRIDNFYSVAWHLINHQPFGVGWPVDLIPGGDQQYPHNLFLELVLAWGVLPGLLCALLVLFATLKTVSRAAEWPAIAAFSLYLLINAQLSGDLLINRWLFFVVGLGLTVNLASRQKRVS